MTELPSVAKVGQLDEARTLLEAKQFIPAWNATLTALHSRPFHPEAWLLLAQIAQTAGDLSQVKTCLERARQLAPQSKLIKQFPKPPTTTATQPTIDWPALPPASSEPRISLCLIVKNEERFLAQCLRSARHLVHQIVVVDTGSTDRTVEIAREFGAEIHSFTWIGDFSAARNAALEHATGDWILVLDADEELSTKGQQEIQREVRDISVMAYRIPIENVGSNEGDGYHYVPRLFRNAAGVYFTGRVHEQAFTSIEKQRLKWALSNSIGKTLLLHHGYSKEMVEGRSKCERNLRLLEEAIKETPDDPSTLMNYGLELVNAGRIEEALVQYRQAFVLMSALKNVAPEVRDRFLSIYSFHALSAKQFDEVVRVLRSPLACKTGFLSASMHFVLGMALAELKQYKESAEELRQCLAKRDRPTLTPAIHSIRTGTVQHALAICLVNLQQPAAAEKEFLAALAENPAAPNFRLDYARFLAQSGRHADVIEQMKPLMSQLKENAVGWRYGNQLLLGHPNFQSFAQVWTEEALKACPKDLALLTQRVDALVLNSRAEEAWQLLHQHAGACDAAMMALTTLCALLANKPHQPVADYLEKQVSQEFFVRFCWLVRVGAQNQVRQIGQQLEQLRPVLPSAAAMIHTALTEARRH